MDRCPNCGTPGRPGANFCTTCGYRFPNEGNADGIDDSRVLSVPSDDETPKAASAETLPGWPSPPAPAEAYSSDVDQPAANAMSAPAESGDDPAETGVISSSWPNETSDSWPAPPAADAVIPTPIDSSSTDVEAEPAVNFELAETDLADNAESMQRALRLLDELREAITAIGPNTAIDFSGVISDLEVAVTPPGAMAADDVAELREALLAARERPRDVDTIVDLTKRVDAMVALIIAYDRTIAAIERSLAALRR